MAFKPLDRTAEDYLAIMTEWLTCKALTNFERSLIEKLKSAAEAGLGEFDEARKVMMKNFGLPIWACIAKARAEGLCKQWTRQHA